LKNDYFIGFHAPSPDLRTRKLEKLEIHVDECAGYDKVRVQSVAELTKMTLHAGIFTASCLTFPKGQQSGLSFR
jgi:hypothetical protein